MRRAVAAATLALALGPLLVACSGDEPSADPARERTGQSRAPKQPGGTGAGSTTATGQASPTGAPTPSAEQPSAPPLTQRFVPAETARELARRLTTAEDLVRDRSTTGDLLEAAAFETQLLYRQLARTPAWVPLVRDLVPGRYRADVAAHVLARRSLRSVITTLSDELPSWRIVEPAPVGRLLSFYREGEREYGVPWEVLAAINLVETGFGKIDGLSSAGAQGPMQFIPSTWAAYGEGDVNDPHDAILAAARYLDARGGSGGPEQLRQALYAYNNHGGYVDGILAYASVLQRDPDALRGLHRWQIIYLSTIGDIWLPVGYRESEPVPVRRYVEQHPERRLGTTTS